MCERNGPCTIPRVSTLSLEVSKARRTKKLSLREVAVKANLTHQSVYRLEHGEGGLRAAAAVLKALGFAKAHREELLKSFAVQLYA